MISRKIFFLFNLIALCLVVLLTLITLKKYNYNFTALIYVWEGFYNLNSDSFPKGFVIHTQGGYDGQFFYLIAHYLFSEDKPPFLDAFELRFRRIGLSILGGLIGYFCGWENYAFLTFVLLWGFHFFSSFLLYEMLKESGQQDSILLYLFSPFSWGSNFLLVSDSLFASFLIFSIFFLQKLGLEIDFEVRSKSKSTLLHIATFLVVLFFLFIRETGVLFIIPFLLISTIHKRIKVSFILSLCLLFYFGFVFYVNFFHIHPKGTNPLSFIQLIDFPFFGFFKSFWKTSSDWKGLMKAIVLVILICLACLHFMFIPKKLRDFLSILPLLFYSILILLAEEGYSNNYDNLSRFFSPCVPYVILLNKNLSFQKKIYFSLVFVLFIVFVMKKVMQGFHIASYFVV